MILSAMYLYAVLFTGYPYHTALMVGTAFADLMMWSEFTDITTTTVEVHDTE